MNSIYVQLAVLVFIFATFGFLLHAFYFGDSRQRRLSRELSDLQKALEEKEKQLRQTEDSGQRSERMIQSLEKQLQQKAVEMDHLKQLAARQDKAIEMLQKDAEVIRAAVSGSAKSVKSVEEALSAVAPVPMIEHEPLSPGPPVPIQKPQPPSARPEVTDVSSNPAHQDSPAWKENLDNILSMLDTMEKEVDK